MVYRSPARALVLAPALVLGLVSLATNARAVTTQDDPYDLPDAPRSMSLPELTHPDVEGTMSASLGSISGAARTNPAVLGRLSIEVPIGMRRLFWGAAYEIAGAAPIATAGGSRVLGGNVELYVRSVWATRTGLAFGGGLGLLPPVANFSNAGASNDAAMTAASLQPWDYAFFRSGYVTAHPFIDVRDITGRFVIQFRQSFDWSFRAQDLGESVVSAASTLFFGYRAGPLVGVGIEATEFYRIDDPIPDDAHRATFLVAPSLRILTPTIQPALCVFTGMGHPLEPAADSVWGVRMAITVVWDREKPEPAPDSQPPP